MASSSSRSPQRAYVITGPTSGIGFVTALEIAKHGTIVLVGRDQAKTNEVKYKIKQKGGRANCVQCDISNMDSVAKAAREIVGLQLRLAGLVNNAGIHQTKPTKSAQGWDMTFATDHLGPFLLTESLIPHMVDDANVVSLLRAWKTQNANLPKWRGSVGAATSPQRPKRVASGSRVELQRRVRMHTQPRNSAHLRPRWISPASTRGCTSTQSSLVLIQLPLLAARQIPLYDFSPNMY